jgi:hypothetical protein
MHAQLAVSLLSGLVAGVASAVVSHPADTILSTMNRDGSLSLVVSPEGESRHGTLS